MVGDGCHSGGATPTVTISGPTTITAGSAGNAYTISANIGGLTPNNMGCGLDVGVVGGGTLAAGAGTKLSGGEIVHNGVINVAGSTCSGGFSLTAPAAAASLKINGTLNAVNKDGRTGCDKSGLASLTVTVSPGVTTTGATVATTTGATVATTTGATVATTTMGTTPGTTLADMPAEVEFCGYCHGLTIGKHTITQVPYMGAPIRHKPAGMSERKWKRIIKKMISKEGCPVDDAAAKKLAKYFSSIKR